MDNKNSIEKDNKFTYFLYSLIKHSNEEKLNKILKSFGISKNKPPMAKNIKTSGVELYTPSFTLFESLTKNDSNEFLDNFYTFINIALKSTYFFKTISFEDKNSINLMLDIMLYLIEKKNIFIIDNDGYLIRNEFIKYESKLNGLSKKSLKLDKTEALQEYENKLEKLCNQTITFKRYKKFHEISNSISALKYCPMCNPIGKKEKNQKSPKCCGNCAKFRKNTIAVYKSLLEKYGIKGLKAEKFDKQIYDNLKSKNIDGLNLVEIRHKYYESAKKTIDEIHKKLLNSEFTDMALVKNCKNKLENDKYRLYLITELKKIFNINN